MRPHYKKFEFNPSLVLEATTTNQRLLDVLNIKLLSKHKKKKKNNSKSWSQRVNALEEKWEEYREEIFAAAVRSYNFDGICKSCKMNEIAVKCDECFTKMLCNQCDKQIHETLTLHNRTSIIDGYKRILNWSKRMMCQIRAVCHQTN